MNMIAAKRGWASAQAGLWVSLNLLDIGLSQAAMYIGATEVNLIVQLFGMSWWAFTAYKLAMTVLVVAVLAHTGKMHLLRWLNIGMGCICLWNTLVILTS